MQGNDFQQVIPGKLPDWHPESDLNREPYFSREQRHEAERKYLCSVYRPKPVTVTADDVQF